ncbi:MAG: outer membrane lipoprotein carrier protein LolA [Bacteroidales bacterium]|nr:outer membrane lipoprotein carrier protein LolA [Bacteroidales bacterium]
MRKILYIAFLLIGHQLVFAQESNYTLVPQNKEIETKINNMANSLNTIQSDFTQQKHMTYLSVTVESKGKFWYQKENKMRWQYTEPYKYTILIKDGKITIDDGGKNSEFKVKGNKIFEQMNEIISASIKGTIMKDERFAVTLYENNAFYMVKLLPKSPEVKEVIAEMFMYFDKTGFSVSKVKMVEKSGDYTLINFSNKKVNDPIPASVFILN